VAGKLSLTWSNETFVQDLRWQMYVDYDELMREIDQKGIDQRHDRATRFVISGMWERFYNKLRETWEIVRDIDISNIVSLLMSLSISLREHNCSPEWVNLGNELSRERIFRIIGRLWDRTLFRSWRTTGGNTQPYATGYYTHAYARIWRIQSRRYPKFGAWQPGHYLQAAGHTYTGCTQRGRCLDREWVTRVAWLWHNTCDAWPFICQSNFNTPETTPQKFAVSIPPWLWTDKFYLMDVWIKRHDSKRLNVSEA